jgi:hypothetical protein
MEKRSIKSNASIKEEIRMDMVTSSQNRPVLSRPSTTFTSVPIKLVNYHISRPLNSRTKVIESIQKSTIICYRCKKLKPNTFLKESQVSLNKICDCSQQLHSIKIQKPQEKKIVKQESRFYDYGLLFAEGKSINASPNKIRRFYSDTETQKTVENTVFYKSVETNKEVNMRLKFLVFKGNNSELIRETMKRRELWSEGHHSITNSVNLIWQPTSVGLKFDRLKPFLPTQIANHFEFHSELTNKIMLYKNLVRFCKDNSQNVQDLVPCTFVFEPKSQGYRSHLEHFKVFFKRCAVRSPVTHFSGKNIWIFKPSSFNRGRGISVFDKLETFERLCDGCEEHFNFVIQKYIESPLLFHDRKFDIRMWVLITHDTMCYVFPYGYIRTSSESYSSNPDLLSNKFIHLTNNAVQKESTDYGRFENGNQISFTELEDYIKNLQANKTFNQVLFEMYELIITSLKAVREKLNPRCRQFCFEIFGYDFIIDSELKPWLIEVNTNPCLELSSPLLAQLIPRMIEDAFELTVDAIFQSGNKQKLQTEVVLDLPQGNLWQYLIKI